MIYMIWLIKPLDMKVCQGKKIRGEIHLWGLIIKTPTSK